MSNFLQWTKHPRTGEWYQAEWLDDYFGHHDYGVRFPDDEVFNALNYDLEISDTKPSSSSSSANDKEKK